MINDPTDECAMGQNMIPDAPAAKRGTATPLVGGVGDSIPFGAFILSVAGRRVECNGVPLAIGSRALDILIALVQRAGQIVTKRELISAVWPDTTVEESSLRVHIAGLRKALGDGVDGNRFISNVAGRGYCFVAALRKPALDVIDPPTLDAGRSTTLPPLPSLIIGREDVVSSLQSILSGRRLVSIVGPGGMGKTTVAIAIGHRLEGMFRDGVCFVDFASVSEPDLVPATILAAMGLKNQSIEPADHLIATLARKQLLLILDTCETVVAGVAPLVERLCAAAPEVRILVTSRETLRAESEHIHRLAPLSSPPDAPLSLQEALRFAAVELFLESALAGGAVFEMTDREAPIICDICRKLDGLALALQLVAGRVEGYGLEGTAALLSRRLWPSLQGRRTALPRHKTLQALFDWSYNLLPEVERTVLRRLSVFLGPFSVDAATAVVCDEEITSDQLAEVLGSLVAKSLAAPVMIEADIHYQLLDTTREYASGRLSEEEHPTPFLRQHAEYYLNMVQGRTVDGAAVLTPESVELLARKLGNVRAALRWCFSSTGDTSLGVRLAASSEPVFLSLSLLQEARSWAEVALAATATKVEAGREEMELQEALGLASMWTTGNTSIALAAFDRGLEIAEELSDLTRMMSLLSGLHIFQTRIGDAKGALATAQRGLRIAEQSSDLAAQAVARWMLGTSQHLLGDQRQAEISVADALAHAPAMRRDNMVYFGLGALYDLHRRQRMCTKWVWTLAAYARCLWLRGHPEKALATCETTIYEADRFDHPISLCIALIYTTTVFMWSGDWVRTASQLQRLIEHADRHGLAPYRAVGLCLQGELFVRTGAVEKGLAQLEAGLRSVHQNRHEMLATTFLQAQAEGFIAQGNADAAIAVLDQALAIARNNGGSFDLPELLRNRGRAAMISGRFSAISKAQQFVEASLSEARNQGAVAWELRAAMTLAGIRRQRGNMGETIEVLEAILKRFGESWTGVDLRSARELVCELRAL
jgi:predicted ATPase/DNA-binding winged helix-turn-helix (wHTH) protein